MGDWAFAANRLRRRSGGAAALRQHEEYLLMDQIAVVGIGTTGFGKFAERSGSSMANDALSAALEDAGLERGHVDGLVSQIGSPRGLDYDELARLLCLDLRYATQTWDHG